MRTIRTLLSVAVTAAVGLGTFAGTASATTLTASPPVPELAALQAAEVDLPDADVLDVDFRDGGPTDHAQDLSPEVLGDPTVSTDLITGRLVTDFDGEDDAIRYPFRDQHGTLDDAMSLECSFRITEAQAASSSEGGLCASKEGGGFATVVNDSRVIFMINLDGTYHSVRTDIEADRWYHTVAVWDGQSVQLYVNGEQIGEGDTDATGAYRHPSGNADSIMLGADVHSSNNPQFWAETTIGAARVYSDALTADQASALAAADQQGPTAPEADVVDLAFTADGPVERAQGLSPQTFGTPEIREDAPMGTTVAEFDGNGSAYLYPFEEQYAKLEDEMTIECVFKYNDDLPSEGEDRGNLCGAKQGGGFSITLYGDRLSFNPNIGGSYRNTNVQVESGRWYHAVGVYTGSEVQLYVNGVLAATTPTTGTLQLPSAGGRNLVIGADAGGRDRPQFYAPATISQVRVFSRAVDQSEVLALGREAYAGRPADYAVTLSASNPAQDERLTSSTRYSADFVNPEGLGRNVTHQLDGDEIRPGQQIGAGLAAGEHTITITGNDVFGGVIDESVTFTSANIPAEGGTETGQEGGEVTLSANATNPSGGEVRTTFREADVVVAEAGRQGVLDAIPTTRQFTADAEEPVDAPLAPGDEAFLDSPSTGRVPFQQFDVTTASQQNQQVVWSGTVDPAREVVLRVWNGGEWEELSRVRGQATGEVQLVGDVRARHRHDGVVPVLITGEDPFADDLENETRDAFEDPAEYDFSIAHLTDTQYLSEGAVEQETEAERAVWRDAYQSIPEWITQNAAARKIAFTAHTGDIIENWHNPTDDPAIAREEFEVASQIQQILDDAGLVNTVLPGNHDNIYGADNDMYNEYFGPDRYGALSQTAPWQAAGAVHQPWKPGDNQNNYVLFSAAGLDFVVVSLGFGVTAEETAWADGVLKQFGDRNAIVLTHAYLTPSANPDGRGSGFSYDGRQVLDGVLRKNDNVALVLSGHEHGVSIELRRDTAAKNHHVLELLADYQFYKVNSDDVGLTGIGYDQNTPLQLGSSFFRMLQFDVDAGEVAVDTYSPMLENFGATEYDDRGRYDGTEDDTRLPVDLSSRTTSFSSGGLVVVDPSDRVIGEDTVRSGWPASVVWDGLESGRTYAWQATSVDAASGDTLPGQVSQISLFTATDAGTDVEPPQLTIPDSTVVALNADFDPMDGVSAVDAVDGDVTASVTVTGSVDTTTAGSYALAYVAEDANGNQTLATRVVTVGEAPAPVNTERPTIGGSAAEGAPLRADLGTWANADAATFSVQWLRDGEPIEGAVGGDYRPTSDDVDREVSIRVTATVGEQSVTATSEAVVVQAAAAEDPDDGGDSGSGGAGGAGSGGAGSGDADGPGNANSGTVDVSAGSPTTGVQNAGGFLPAAGALLTGPWTLAAVLTGLLAIAAGFWLFTRRTAGAGRRIR